MQLVQYLYDSYQFDINQYSTDGMNCIHLAAYGGHLHIIQWLIEKGADCHSKTLYLNKTAYDFVCSMLCRNEPPDGHSLMTLPIKNKLLELKSFLRSRYFLDNRGKEIRKFIWVYNKLKAQNTGIGKMPQPMIQEIAEYI